MHRKIILQSNINQQERRFPTSLLIVGLVLLGIVLTAGLGFATYKVNEQKDELKTKTGTIESLKQQVVSLQKEKKKTEEDLEKYKLKEFRFPDLMPTIELSSTIDISKWKVYTSKDYNFEFRYPETHIIVQNKEYPSEPLFVYNKKYTKAETEFPQIEIEKFIPPDYGKTKESVLDTLETWLSWNYSLFLGPLRFWTENARGFNNRKAIIMDNGMRGITFDIGDLTKYSVFTNGKVIIVFTLYFSNNEEETEIYNNILTTFRFL